MAVREPAVAAVWGRGEPVVFLHGSMVADPIKTWHKQRSLEDRYRLVVAARAGYGDSTADPAVDFSQCVAEAEQLLGEGAHLVGHSYGGVIAMLTAAARPDLVRSLTVAEPPAFGVARGVPVVEAAIEAFESIYPCQTPEEFARGFARALSGKELPESLELGPLQRKAATATMTEPWPWMAEIPLQQLAATPFPKLVVSGGWSEPMEAVADRLSEGMGAQREIIRRYGHGFQLSGEPFNNLLLRLWARV